MSSDESMDAAFIDRLSSSKDASRVIGQQATAAKDAALSAIAQNLRARAQEIIEANALDMASGEKTASIRGC